MAYIIIDIHEAQHHTHDQDGEHRIDLISKRAKLDTKLITAAHEALKSSKWEVHPDGQLGSLSKDWPLLATVYMSSNKEGKGRVGGCFEEYTARKRENRQ